MTSYSPFIESVRLVPFLTYVVSYINLFVESRTFCYITYILRPAGCGAIGISLRFLARQPQNHYSASI